MTNSVMEKVRVRKAARKQRVCGVAICAAVCCLVLAMVTVGKNTGKTTSVIQMHNHPNTLPAESAADATVSSTMPNAKPSVKVLCAVSDNDNFKILEENVRVPYMAELRVKIVSGMSETERRQILAEEKIHIQEVLGESPDESSYSQYTRDNVIVTMISAGDISIAFDDIETVSHIQVSTTENGYIFYPRISGIQYNKWDESGRSVAVDGERLRKGLEMLGTDNFTMHWSIDPSVADRFNEDPNMEMGQISDRITITIAYMDGSVETKTVVIQTCDDGQMTILLLKGTLLDQIPA